MYDLANQSFTLHVNTLLFALFLKNVIVNDPKQGDLLWGAMAASSMLLVALASPVAGAISDFKARKKAALIALGLGCAVFTLGLAALQPGWIVLAFLLYIPANWCFAMGENFLAAFLPELSTSANLGRISAIGWTLGYVGALVLLVGTWAGMQIWGLQDPASWRPFIAFAAIWFLVFMIPTALFLRERSTPQPLPRGRTLVGIGFERLWTTVKDVRRYRDMAAYLAAFFVYSMGIQAIIFFAVVIADDFGWGGTRLVEFLMPVTVLAGIGAASAGWAQDRFGHKRVVAFFILTFFLTAVGLLAIPAQTPGQPQTGAWIMWLVACGIGLALGGAGTSGRALLGLFVPRHKAAEFFGLRGLADKLSAVVGLGVFSVVKSQVSDNVAFILLAITFAVGALLLIPVNIARGQAVARAEEEREVGTAP